MQDTFAKVKSAIDLSNEKYSIVTVKDGMMYGTNGHMMAAVPTDLPDFNVSAFALDKFLSVSPTPTVKITDKSLVLTQGKSKSRLPLLEKSIEGVPPEPTTSVVVDEQFKNVLRTLQPFAGLSHIYLWQCGVSFGGGKSRATNGSIVAEYDYDLGGEFLLNFRAVDYVLKRKERVTKIDVTDNALVLRFEDGSWLQIQRIAKENLENIPKIMANMYRPPQTEITAELRQAFAQAFLSKAEVIELSRDGVKAEVSGGDVNVEGETLLETESVWTAKAINMVFENATHLDIDTTNESPSSFKGPHIRGLILRRKKACDRQQS
jgi:hypothetical protein